jgi:hypothetical protein
VFRKTSHRTEEPWSLTRRDQSRYCFVSPGGRLLRAWQFFPKLFQIYIVKQIPRYCTYDNMHHVLHALACTKKPKNGKIPQVECINLCYTARGHKEHEACQTQPYEQRHALSHTQIVYQESLEIHTYTDSRLNVSLQCNKLY